jgi:hypothetical protein
VLSVVFHPLWLLAVTSLLVSLGVCVAAGLQAALPKKKTRVWSRPLVAALFFLQPIARGWARYRRRLVVHRTPAVFAARENLDSMALRSSNLDLRQLRYWAEQRINRLDFVADILRRLDQQGWPHRADIGWSEHDVAVYDRRWSKLLLTTVAEEHPQGKQLIKCRLQPRWSLRAKVAFWSFASLLLVLLGFAGTRTWWHWLLLLLLPLFGWYLHRQQRHLQSLLAVFLDELAKEWNLAKVLPQRAEPQPPPAQEPGAFSERKTVAPAPGPEIQNSKPSSG